MKIENLEHIPQGDMHQRIAKVNRAVYHDKKPVVVTFWREPYVAIVPVEMLRQLLDDGTDED